MDADERRLRSAGIKVHIAGELRGIDSKAKGPALRDEGG